MSHEATRHEATPRAPVPWAGVSYAADQSYSAPSAPTPKPALRRPASPAPTPSPSPVSPRPVRPDPASPARPEPSAPKSSSAPRPSLALRSLSPPKSLAAVKSLPVPKPIRDRPPTPAGTPRPPSAADSRRAVNSCAVGPRWAYVPLPAPTQGPPSTCGVRLDVGPGPRLSHHNPRHHAGHGPAPRSLMASRHRPYPGDQFSDAEWFRQVVVGAELQAQYAVGLLAARAEDDDGDVGGPADPAAHVYAVHVGQAEVQQDDIAVRPSQPVRAGGHVVDRQAEVPQPVGERFGDRLVVLDEQHSYAHGRLSLQKVGTTRDPCCGAPRYKRPNTNVQGIRSIVK